MNVKGILRGLRLAAKLDELHQQAPPESEGKTLSHSALFLSGRPVGSTGTGADAYDASWVAYSAIRRIAQYGAAVPLLFLSDPDDPDSTVPPTHPVRRMFERPNPYFSTGEFMQWLYTMLNLRGEFFIAYDDPMRPTRMYQYTDPLNWQDVQDEGELVGWVYRRGAIEKRWLPEEIINHRLIDPSRPYRGQPPLRAALVPFETEQGASELTRDVVRRGGEKAMLFEPTADTTPEQREQLIADLRGRRTNNRVGRDIILPGVLKPVDPKFVEDELDMLRVAELQPKKIAAVYGIPLSLMGYEDVDKYATFEGRKRMFYEDTMIPMANGIESAFDRAFNESGLRSAYRVYVRFDWSAVDALQDKLGDKFRDAGQAHKDGLPWSVLNDRFELGLDTSKIPGADTVLVSSTQIPIDALLDEWADGGPEPMQDPEANAPPAEDDPAEDDPAARGLTNAIIRKRARNVRDMVQRNMRILRAEQDMAKEWRAALQPLIAKAQRAVAKVGDDPGAVESALSPVFKGLGDKLGNLATKYHRAAALEGEESIVELVEGKMDNAQREAYRKAHQWRPEVSALIKARHNRVVGMSDDIFRDVVAACERAVIDGEELAEVQHVVRRRFHSAPGGINRATTIARTEVGTAYNTARFAEVKGQGFKRHQWLTNADELVRGPEDEYNHQQCHEQIVKVGEQFPNGLTYPQEDGGDAGNVINCRCLTIPVLEDR